MSRPLGPALGAVTLGLALLLTGCTGTSDATTTRAAAATQSIGVDEFAAAAERPGVVLIDVRTPAEFAEGHLAGAVNLDIGAPDFADAVAGLRLDGSYAVYCRSGNRSAQALAVMRSSGIEDAVHLDGGIGAWAGAGRPLVTAP